MWFRRWTRRGGVDIGGMSRRPRVALTLNPFAGGGGGSRSFARVLAEGLPRYGVDVSFGPPGRCDCVVVFAHFGSVRKLTRCRRRGVKIVHRIDERRDPDEVGERGRKHDRIACLNALADVTVFQSRFVKGNMGPICSAPQEVVIYNGVDQRIFRPDGPKAMLTGAPRILHVSWSIGKSKRLDRILELACCLGPEARVYLVGRHAESELGFLDTQKVSVLGPKGRRKIAAIMRGCDFLFFPSQLDPCPNTVLEAIACGLPVLYDDSGGTSELMGEAGVPLTASVCAGVRQVLEHQEGLRRRSLARAERFTATIAVQAYATLIKKVIESKSV